MVNKLYRNYERFITIIVPCRARHQRTVDLLESIEKTTYDKKNVAVITITDWDVPEDFLNIQKSQQGFSYDLINIARSQHTNLHKNYINLAALMTESYYIWVMGNDNKVITQNWDLKLINALSSTAQHIIDDTKEYYIYVDDDTHSYANDKTNDGRGCCFPILSNNFCVKTRGPYPNWMEGWGADQELYKHFIEKGKESPERFSIIDLSDSVKLEHICAHNYKVEQDGVNKLMEIRHDAMKARFLALGLGLSSDP